MFSFLDTSAASRSNSRALRSGARAPRDMRQMNSSDMFCSFCFNSMVFSTTPFLLYGSKSNRSARLAAAVPMLFSPLLLCEHLASRRRSRLISGSSASSFVYSQLPGFHSFTFFDASTIGILAPTHSPLSCLPSRSYACCLACSFSVGADTSACRGCNGHPGSNWRRAGRCGVASDATAPDQLTTLGRLTPASDHSPLPTSGSLKSISLPGTSGFQ